MTPSKFLLGLYQTAFMLFMLAPIAVVVLVAFTPLNYLDIPTTAFSLRWFRAIFRDSDYVESFRLSLTLGAASATLGVALAMPATLALARYRFRGRDVLTSLFMSPMVIPAVFLGVAFLRFLTIFHMNSTWFALVICHTVITFPFALRLCMASFANLERNIERAAASLGAPPFSVFFRITVPAVLPGLIGGWVFAFLTSFDELTVTMFVSSPSLTTLPVRLFSHIAQTIDPLAASVSTLIIGVSLVLMLVLDRLLGMDRLFLKEAR